MGRRRSISLAVACLLLVLGAVACGGQGSGGEKPAQEVAGATTVEDTQGLPQLPQEMKDKLSKEDQKKLEEMMQEMEKEKQELKNLTNQEPEK